MSKRSLMQLLGDSWNLIARNFTAMSLTVAIVYIPLCLLSFFLMAGSFMFQSKLDFLSAERSIPTIIVFIILFAVFITFAFIALMLFAMAIIKQIQACDQEQNVPFFEAYRQSLPLFGSFCVVVLWVLFKVSLWALLFVIPGIVFALFYSFAQLVFVLEGRSGVEALKQSRSLIQPFFWEFVGKSFVVMVLFFLASWILHMAITFVIPAQAGLGRIAIGSLENFLNGLLSIFPTAFGYFLYKDLKARTGEG